MRAKLLLSLIAILPAIAWAQSSSAGANDTPQEVIRGGYVIHQSVEVGYRYNDMTGSGDMYNTFVNLQDGPRLLEQTLSMQSEHHDGLLFDDVTANSVGWGGDPNNYLRMRVGKSLWYDFRASFRRDHDYFNFNLLANPLNPTTSVPNVPLEQSAHGFATRRRMSDIDLTLLPQSKISFRLGYSRNNMSGSSWTSIHEGTDAMLLQPWNTTLNSYRMGADLKLLPRTVFSYDQTLSYFKGDNSAQLNSAGYALANGTPVDLGVVFNTGANSPCATPILGTGAVNPACNGYFAYSRFNATRTSFPTERLSMRSNYFRRVDLNSSFSYTSGDSKLPVYAEVFDGLATRTRNRTLLESGSALTRRISAGADAAATIHVTDRFRIMEQFRFDHFRIPGVWDYTIATSFGATLTSIPNVFTPATCPPPYTAATCPQHNSSSGADLTNDAFFNFLKQDQKTNTLEAQYDFTRKISGRLGYRLQRRTIVHQFGYVQDLTFYPSLANRGACEGLPVVNGVCTTTAGELGDEQVEINAHSLLAGVSLRPTAGLRMSFDTEQLYADDAFTRTSPRKESRYRVMSSYAARSWAVISGTVNVYESANDDSLTKYLGHSRNFGINLSLTPYERFGVELAYNYNDVLQNAFICFNDTPPAGVSLPLVDAALPCAADPENPLLTNSYYNNNTHYGFAAATFKPVKRVSANLGYSITSVGGKTPQFNILQPLGSLAYNYHEPIAGLTVDLGHNVAWNALWNYYQYNEKSFVGPTAARYFHANNATFSVRYGF